MNGVSCASDLHALRVGFVLFFDEWQFLWEAKSTDEHFQLFSFDMDEEDHFGIGTDGFK